MKVTLVVLSFFINYIMFSQSTTQNNLLDTTIIYSKIGIKATLLIDSPDFKLSLNKKYFISLLKKKTDKKELIKKISKEDTLYYDKPGSPISLSKEDEFVIKEIILNCISKGEFVFVKNNLCDVYYSILCISNSNQIAKELQQKDYSCKRQYMEFLLPDKKTSIFIQISYITPRAE